VKIERATLKNAYTLAVLTQRFFPYTGIGYPQVVERLNNPEIEYYVALEGKATIGFTDLEVKPDGQAKVLGLAVLPENRRKGYGSALLDKALERVAAHGARKCTVLVAEDNAIAQKLYGSRGFASAGILDYKLWDKTVLLMSRQF
jgi:ribosomal protein S18 acetylase RimI-like enzyme